jgi:hypothetical protein
LTQHQWPHPARRQDQRVKEKNMRRTLRVLVLVGAALTLVGVGTPPASAGDLGTAVFEGTAIVTGGLGYPCTPPGTTDCTVPPTVSAACALQLHKKCGLVSWNNGVAPMRTGSFTSGLFCIGAELNFGIKGKGDKPIGNVGTCVVSASFNLLGWCGLSHGMGTGLIELTGALGTNNLILFDFLWQSTATVLVFTVQWWKGAWTKPANPNKGAALVHARPDVPGTTGQSCTNGTQQNFTIDAAATLFPVKN